MMIFISFIARMLKHWHHNLLKIIEDLIFCAEYLSTDEKIAQRVNNLVNLKYHINQLQRSTAQKEDYIEPDSKMFHLKLLHP